MSIDTTPIGEAADTHVVPTIVEFLLDETSSMETCKHQTIGGFNEFIDEQRTGDGSFLFTLTKFDSSSLETPYVDIDIGMVPHLSVDTFLPNGMTNLHDSIVARINALRTRLAHWDIQPRVLFVVMTDGQDNMSRISGTATRAEIEQASNEGWTFVYLGANQDANLIACDLGFSEGNIRSFASAEMQETMRGFSKSATAYRATATASSATRNFF